MNIQSVSGLNVNGARFVEIVHDGGVMTVLRDDGDTTLAATLVRAAAEQRAYAAKIVKRARVMAAAAEFVIRPDAINGLLVEMDGSVAFNQSVARDDNPYSDFENRALWWAGWDRSAKNKLANVLVADNKQLCDQRELEAAVDDAKGGLEVGDVEVVHEFARHHGNRRGGEAQRGVGAAAGERTGGDEALVAAGVHLER